MSHRLMGAEKNAAKFPAFKSVAEQILTNAQDSRPVVQDFVPLAQSLQKGSGTFWVSDGASASEGRGWGHTEFISRSPFS